ncbi:hypothetical protein [Hydrogenophaga pseudoflava]|uniref:Macro domain-containing protein n=1 Tax=Hydrogenophaga pseudoflava TaxID=47421 RepID=A0A4P6X3G6_HYDPS|nr:hypothetical protein [Hydrogenophaga pseudoflava]QBM29156.1 hypothetical protein HPF_15800 [Hydrogenophaga pseudoflava]
MHNNWFSRLTGFNEEAYATTQAQMEVQGNTLRSKVNGRSFSIGCFEMVSLAELRQRVAQEQVKEAPTQVGIVTGDVRQMHQMPQYAGALFQVASQFNALEMVGPSVTPEDGVTRYEHDRTQGPACAIAAGAATIYRNYFVPVGEQIGQSAEHQLDGLADLGAALGDRLGCPVADLWQMQNGYALASRSGLDKIAALLLQMDDAARSELAGHLRIGLHRDVEVTDGPTSPGPLVSQAFCSALPVAYGSVAPPHWQGFAQLVLDAAYESTVLAAVLNSRQGGSNTVLLTMLGGGAFGNATEWIYTAIERTLEKARGHGLDVRLVSYGPPSAQMRALVNIAGGAR